MRIGFDAKRAFHNFRGLGNYSRDLLAGLHRYYPENDYLLFTPPLKDERALKWSENYSHFSIISPQSKLGQFFPSVWRSAFLCEALKKHSLDIYHGLSHELPPGISKSGIKSIVTIHDLIFLRYPSFFPWVDRKVYFKKIKYACSNADIIISICNQTTSDLINFLDIDEKKIRTVYQTCNPRFYIPCNEEELRKTLSRYNVAGRYILYVGALEERKNALSLVKAYAYLKKSINHQLILIGQGSTYKSEIESYIESKGLSDRVQILSNVSHADLPAFYQGADLFCYPSFFEGFGIPIIESLFSKTPVITSKGSCFPEAAGPGAVYIDPHSIESIALGIESVLTDPKLSHRLVEEGRNYVEKFHHSNTTEELVKIYRELLTL